MYSLFCLLVGSVSQSVPVQHAVGKEFVIYDAFRILKKTKEFSDVSSKLSLYGRSNEGEVLAWSQT